MLNNNINKIQTISLEQDVNELLCQIDVKLSKISEKKLNNERYGAKSCIDYDSYYILNKYRKILEDKAFNSYCLKDYLIDDIISNVKQYLTSGKPQKFKKSVCNSIEDKNTQEDNPVKVEIKYNIGSYTVNNSYSNRYINEVDEWDQLSW